jgi:hypothetical protein
MPLQHGVEDVLLFRAWRQYLKAIQDALAGMETAQVVLTRAVRRLEGQAGRLTSVSPGRRAPD